MNTPTAIIVYRNPAEAALWEMVMNSPYIFPGAVAFAALVGGVIFFDKFLAGYLPYTYRANASLVFGAICAFAVFWFMV